MALFNNLVHNKICIWTGFEFYCMKIKAQRASKPQSTTYVLSRMRKQLNMRTTVTYWVQVFNIIICVNYKVLN
jgi:hypothetical protein